MKHVLTKEQQRKGGRNATAKLSKPQRVERARGAAKSRWKKDKADLEEAHRLLNEWFLLRGVERSKIPPELEQQTREHLWDMHIRYKFPVTIGTI